MIIGWRYRVPVATILLATLLVAACTGDQSTADTTTASSISARTILDDEAGDDATIESTPDSLAMEAMGPQYPLTGLPAPSEDKAARPVLMVKIDNHPQSRPQTGLDRADVVFDLRAEGITRFAAVFQSDVPDPVGPVRSSRTSDFDLLRGFDRPLYASSGGNDYVAAGLRSLPIVSLTNLTRREYFRDASRPAPHNLYVNASDLYALAPDDIPAPEPWFTYRRDTGSLPDTATAVAGPVRISFRGSPVVTHTWSSTVGGWLRTQDRTPHTTAEGDQLAPENVVIMVTDYSTSPADSISPEVRSTGDGPVVVLTDGHAIAGRWSRPTASDRLELTDGNGDVIALTPGRTWVLMPESGQVSFADGETPNGWLG